MCLRYIDFENRFYDPSIGRFTSVDKLADHLYQVDKSPYSGMWNNPILLNDPDGNFPWIPAAIAAFRFAKGALTEVATQKAANKITSSDQKIDLFDVAVSGGIEIFDVTPANEMRMGAKLLSAVGEEALKESVDVGFSDDGLKIETAVGKIQNGELGEMVTNIGIGVTSDLIGDIGGELAAQTEKETVQKASREIKRTRNGSSNNVKAKSNKVSAEFDAKINRSVIKTTSTLGGESIKVTRSKTSYMRSGGR